MTPLHPDDPLLGMTLGGCRIEAVLGRGGMGTVYRGHHHALDKAVAVKLLAPHLACDPSFVDRFLHEARAAARIEHPNVVQILNVGQEHEQHFIVMQYVEGENLQDVLERRGRLDASIATRIAREVACGLQALHKEGIVHRDIKPANILLPRGGGGIKITDFGLARNLRKGGPGMTQPGTFMGTPEFVAPEQILGSIVDGRADLYALGVTYFLTLSGELPFPLRTVPDPQAIEGEAQPPALETLVPGIDARVARVVQRLLRKDPKERFPDAGALLSELESVVNGGAGVKTAKPESPVPEIQVKGRRIPASAAAPKPAEDEAPVISAGPRKRLVDQGPIVPREIVRALETPSREEAPPSPAGKRNPYSAEPNPKFAKPASPPGLDETVLAPPPPPAPPPPAPPPSPPAPPLAPPTPARPKVEAPPAPKAAAPKALDRGTLVRESVFWLLFLAGCGLLFSAGALGSIHRSDNLLTDLPRLLFDQEGFLLRSALAGFALIALIVALVLERPRLEQLRIPAVPVVLLLAAGLTFYVVGVLGSAAGGSDPLILRVLRGSLGTWAYNRATLAAGAVWGAAAGLCLGARAAASGVSRLLGALLVLGALAAAAGAASDDAAKAIAERLKARPMAAGALVAPVLGLVLAFGARRKPVVRALGILLVAGAVTTAFAAGMPAPPTAESVSSRLNELWRASLQVSGSLSLSGFLGWWGAWLLYR